jgi:2,3-bisphosphoglycerate-independent phosphoglycerate mutase
MVTLAPLKKIQRYVPPTGPLLVVIMDGLGIGEKNDANAVYKANAPTLKSLFESKLSTTLFAHGCAVGAPSDLDMGNSEIGHNAIGAGRIFNQGAKLVKEALETARIYDNEHWKKSLERTVPPKKGVFHFIGLLSNGNVHSHIDHLLQMTQRAAESGVHTIRIHPLLDGRDVFEKSACQFVEILEDHLRRLSQKTKGDYRIASGGGRMKVTMDRYNADWAMVEQGWNTHVHGLGRPFPSAKVAIETLYQEDPRINDQLLPAFVIVDENNQPIGKIQDGDSVVFFNFRGDRAIEISRAFEERELSKINRGRIPEVYFSGMMQYDGDLKIPKNFLVDPPKIQRTFCEYLLQEKTPLFAISETQKFGHVTYFWNGNRSGYLNPQLEKYTEVPSDKIEFDQAPQMKAAEITDVTIQSLKSGAYKFGRINFANADMVGHTGNFDATVKAIEAVDQSVSRILHAIKQVNGIAIITADHGNADVMYTIEKGKKVSVTSHTLNPVPFVIFDPQYRDQYTIQKLEKPGLANIAATCLNLLGYEKVADYEPSLIQGHL